MKKCVRICNWRIDELKVIADAYGLDYRQPGGSHVPFRFPNKRMLTIPAYKPIKPVYIKQFIKLLEEYGGENEEA